MTAEEALFDTLLPGGGAFPPASVTALDARIAGNERFGGTVAPVLARLPPGFGDLALADRVAALRGVEFANPTEFAALLTAAYSLYYTHPLVALAIERVTGQAARPPQPEGYSLKAFDPALVAIPAARGRLYRTTEEDRP